MNAIILAAGYATRLEASAKGKPEEKKLRDLPKALLPVKGRPLLGYLLDQLPAACNTTIVTNSRYYSKLDDWQQENCYSCRLIDNGSKTNADRLGAVRDFELGLEGVQDWSPIFLAASDVLLPSFNFHKFYDTFICHGDCILAAESEQKKIRGRYGCVVRNHNGRVAAFTEKPAKPLSSLRSVPYYFLKPTTARRVSEYLGAGLPADPIGRFFEWLAIRTPLYCDITRDPYIDVGTYADWKAANATQSG